MKTSIRFEFSVYPSSNIRGEDYSNNLEQIPLATKVCSLEVENGIDKYPVDYYFSFYNGFWWLVTSVSISSNTVKVRCSVFPNTDKRRLISLVEDHDFIVNDSVARKDGFDYLLSILRSFKSGRQPGVGDELVSKFIPLTPLSDTPENH